MINKTNLIAGSRVLDNRAGIAESCKKQSDHAQSPPCLERGGSNLEFANHSYKM